MTLRRLVVAVSLTVLAATVVRAEDGARRTRRAPAAPVAPAGGISNEDRQLLHQLGDAQRWVNDQLQQVKDRIDGMWAEVAKHGDQTSGLEEQVKALREEVKGLYVESSTVKQQIDGLKQDIDGVNANISGFRTIAGFFIAAMILLLAVTFALSLRR